MLTLKRIPFAEWASRPFMGPQVVAIDEQNRIGLWSGTAYALAQSPISDFGSCPYSAEGAWVQPASYAGNPRSDGSIADISSAKNRPLWWAGHSLPLVLGGDARFGGNLQWGTKSTAEGAYPGSSTDTVYTASAASVESSASAWLKFKDNIDGSQEYAMGRVVKRPDGVLRLQQNADDALVTSNPRVQLYSTALINKAGYYRIYFSPQFGDETTPWPAYVSGKDAMSILELKGAGSWPPIAVSCEYDSPTSDTLTVKVARRPVNASGAVVVAAIPGLAKGVRHDFMLEVLLDWSPNGYLAVWHGPERVAVYSGNTLMTDLADSVQLKLCIYRYQYTTKAPDDCALLVHLLKVVNSLQRV